MWSHDFWYHCVLPWVTPAGSLIAVVIAARALAHNRWIRERESTRDRMAQATLVSSWVEKQQWAEVKAIGLRRWVLKIRNASPTVIYACTVTLECGERPWWVNEDVIPPDSISDTFVPPEVVARLDLGLKPAVITMVFTDSANVRWRRDAKGVLAEVVTKKLR